MQQVLAPGGGPESWTVVDERFAVVEPADVFLAHLTAIERSPGTVRAYAFDLRDYFEFLTAHGINWRTVRLEHLGRFVGWLRLPPTMRNASVTSLPTMEAQCSAPTINRKLAAVGSFYMFHHRHGVDCGELLSTMKAGGARGSWRPFLASSSIKNRSRNRSHALTISCTDSSGNVRGSRRRVFSLIVRRRWSPAEPRWAHRHADRGGARATA
ncbi:site-specific integrase [Mycobacterium persicum]|uniref:site-specific integrase n=1 Tax=Mycobacterium TaxID=1763 RepID=UPI003B9687AC